jgi:hypothetical protein
MSIQTLQPTGHAALARQRDLPRAGCELQRQRSSQVLQRTIFRCGLQRRRSSCNAWLQKIALTWQCHVG